MSDKSRCLKRVVPSTLAAETQIMSEAFAEVEWVRGIFEELVNPAFNIKAWSPRTRHRGLLVAGRSMDPSKELGQLLTICDAKSLYDHLHSETAGCTADKRTAIDIQIVRASLDAQGGEVRWIDHSNMYADALAKRNGNVPLPQTLMRTARACIAGESATLEKHKLDPKSRSSPSKTRSDPAERGDNSKRTHCAQCSAIFKH